MAEGISVKYGVNGYYVDVTRHAFQECIKDNMLVIPATDIDRAGIFGGPVVGVLKHICIEKNGVSPIFIDTEEIVLDISDIDRKRIEAMPLNPLITAERKLAAIHQNLKFVGGNLRDEYPEQIMATMFVKSNNKVLELGSNIGRNTLTIASLLDNQENLVTVECDPNTCVTLTQNRDINGFKFRIEDSALSYKPLIQRGWDTIPSETLLPGFTRVKTSTFQELEAKYGIQFDTLVADCEGALYYILSDYPDMLNNITTIIMENDYHDITHKNKVDEIITSKGFSRVYFRGGGWGPCVNNFFEVWVRS